MRHKVHPNHDGFAAQSAIAKWLNFYNTTRPHSALAGATPADVYEKGLPPQLQHKPHRLSALLAAQPEHKIMISRTSSGMIGRPEYTLSLPPPCPTNRDHLSKLNNQV